MTETRRVTTAKRPIAARVRPPGSKSETIRALTAATLARGRSRLHGALRAEDSAAMIGVARALGAGVDNSSDPWVVDGTGGRLTARAAPLDASESGLTARIALVLAALAEGTSVIEGRGRLRVRPIGPLVEALRAQGAAVATTDGGLPATVTGRGGLSGGRVRVDSSKSSQFATALMLGAPLAAAPTRLRLEGLCGSAGYLKVTARVMEAFGAGVALVGGAVVGYDVADNGYRPADHVIEPDASAAVYPLVAAAVTGGTVEICGLRADSEQPDVGVARRLSAMGCRVGEGEAGLTLDARGVDLDPIDADMSDAPDGALALATACCFARGESRLSGLSSLRHKESDRLAALSRELSRLGAGASVVGDGLLIRPGAMRGATAATHGDHRIAMSCALVGLVVEGVEIAEPEVVNKTWPGYWDMLAEIAASRR